MLKRLYPDGPGFSLFLDQISEEDMRSNCRRIVEEALQHNNYSLDVFAVELESIGNSTEYDTIYLQNQIDELDSIYDRHMNIAQENIIPSEIDNIEQSHRKARALSALLHALSTTDYHKNAEECIYEAMHAYEDVKKSFDKIKETFNYSVCE